MREPVSRLTAKVQAALTKAEGGDIARSVEDIARELARRSPIGCSYALSLLPIRNRNSEQLALALRLEAEQGRRIRAACGVLPLGPDWACWLPRP
jgi:hypothetical protein